jgi:tetratricopeptide (TPR) repeat protein
MSANVEMEAQLLQRYWEEAKALCDQLMQVSPQQEKPIKNEINRKLEIYGKQLGSFKSRFPDDVRGQIYEASYYELQALSLLGASSGFRRVPGGGKSLTVALAAGALAKAQEKKMAQQALNLLDRAIATFDQPNSRFMKATIYNGLGRKSEAVSELNYILANFQDSPLYIEARSLKDEIENPPKKGMCFVATAAYGSPLAPEVILLSNFRDDILLSSNLGRVFVKVYYHVSPPLALLIAKDEYLRAATRRLFLAPILRLLKAAKFKS